MTSNGLRYLILGTLHQYKGQTPEFITERLMEELQDAFSTSRPAAAPAPYAPPTSHSGLIPPSPSVITSSEIQNGDSKEKAPPVQIQTLQPSGPAKPKGRKLSAVQQYTQEQLVTLLQNEAPPTIEVEIPNEGKFMMERDIQVPYGTDTLRLEYWPVGVQRRGSDCVYETISFFEENIDTAPIVEKLRSMAISYYTPREPIQTKAPPPAMTKPRLIVNQDNGTTDF